MHILIPVDLSASSRYAALAAKKLASSSAQITLLHVYNPMPSSPYVTFDAAPGQQLIFADIERRRMKSLMKIRRAELDGVENVKVELECTAILSVASAICQFAKSEFVDLIVLTTAARTGLSRVLMGSVAEDVVRLSPCPVLVVRADNRMSIIEDQKRSAGHGANLP
jgi:nucleotide-binding universal stress UspA family protein